ncbi:MAG: esterase-like activity of phytase family protein, partial [Planktothrix sp.]
MRVWKKWVQSLMVLGCSFVFLTACSVPQVSAESRFFVDLSLNFLGKYELSKSLIVNDQTVGNFSSLTYKIPGYGSPTDEGIKFYGLTDASAKIQTIKFDLNPSGSMNLKDISLENSTILKNQQNQPLSDTKIYPDSIAFSPRNSVFISTKTLENSELPPSIAEYDLTTGQLKNTVPLSSFYLPQ